MTDRWWHLDLAAQFPSLEIYSGHGWGPEQELGLVERGDRFMTSEAFWLPTWFYSKLPDRHWAAVSGMFGMICQAMRDNGKYPDIDPIPEGWQPDVAAWESGEIAKRQFKQDFDVAWEWVDDCDTCWYLISTEAYDRWGDDVIAVKLRKHLASGHLLTSEEV